MCLGHQVRLVIPKNIWLFVTVDFLKLESVTRGPNPCIYQSSVRKYMLYWDALCILWRFFVCLFEITLFIYLVNISETSVCGDNKFSQQVYFANILTIRICLTASLNFVHLTQVLINSATHIRLTDICYCKSSGVFYKP